MTDERKVYKKGVWVHIKDLGLWMPLEETICFKCKTPRGECRMPCDPKGVEYDRVTLDRDCHMVKDDRSEWFEPVSPTVEEVHNRPLLEHPANHGELAAPGKAGPTPEQVAAARDELMDSLDFHLKSVAFHLQICEGLRQHLARLIS